MTLPRVSVIVPVYKTEKYIDQCVQTILQQNYQNIEIILVDDGSPDGCGKMCDEYAKQDPRIRVIHKPNGGLSDARNAGIDMATGEYITFVDSDDFILPDMIGQLMRAILSSKADIAQCGFVRCDGSGALMADGNAGKRLGDRVYTADRMRAYLCGHTILTAAWGKIYKAELFDALRFPVGRLHEDVFTTYKAVHRANSVVVTDEAGYVYRVNLNSITTSKYTPQKLDSVYGEIEQAAFIADNYPELLPYANLLIIYSCNQCLLQMAKAEHVGKDDLDFLQGLYRKYGRYYIRGKVSPYGKIVAMTAMVNIRFAKALLAVFRGKT